MSDRISFTESLIATPEQKQTEIILTNPSGITQQLEAGVSLGHSSEVEVVPYASLIFEMDDTGKIAQGGGTNKETDYVTSVLTVKTLDVDNQKEKLGKLLPEEGAALKWQDKDKLLQILLDETERETLTWFKWLSTQENHNQSKYHQVRLHW